jgi:hypothetical protein
MFTEFCTSCGSFDDTTFTSSEKDTIQFFSSLVTNIYNKAKTHTDTYNTCKANVLADFVCDLVAITDDWYTKDDFLDNIKHPETFENSLDTYMKTLDKTTLERYSGDNPDDARNISTELYNYL